MGWDAFWGSITTHLLARAHEDDARSAVRPSDCMQASRPTSSA
jgi:hypothetical protein